MEEQWQKCPCSCSCTVLRFECFWGVRDSSFPSVVASRGMYCPPKDLKAKVKIMHKLDKGALAKTEIAKKYDITKSTFSLDMNRESIFAEYEKQQIQPFRKRLRTSAHHQLEDALIMWIKLVRSRNLPQSKPTTAANRRELTSQMAIEEFLASEGRLSRFRETPWTYFHDHLRRKSRRRQPHAKSGSLGS